VEIPRISLRNCSHVRFVTLQEFCRIFSVPFSCILTHFACTTILCSGRSSTVRIKIAHATGHFILKDILSLSATAVVFALCTRRAALSTRPSISKINVCHYKNAFMRALHESNDWKFVRWFSAAHSEFMAVEEDWRFSINKCACLAFHQHRQTTYRTIAATLQAKPLHV